jgi:HSP20 family protein
LFVPWVRIPRDAATSERRAEMSALTRMKEPMVPFFDEIRRDMEGFWDRPVLFRQMRPLRELAAKLDWAPSMDVFDKNGELFVKVDLPGVRKEDVNVAIDDGDLVVRGVRNEESEVKEAEYYRAERSHGEFYRRLPLAFEADAKKIAAKYDGGVLEIRIPYPLEKKPEPKAVEIK